MTNEKLDDTFPGEETSEPAATSAPNAASVASGAASATAPAAASTPPAATAPTLAVSAATSSAPATLGDLLKPATGPMIASGCLTAISAIVRLVPFVALQQIAVLILREQQQSLFGISDPYLWVIIALISLVASQILYMGGLGVSHLAEAHFRYDLRKQIVDAFAHLPLADVLGTPRGTIRQIICDDTTAVHTLIAHVPGDVTNAVVTLLAGFFLLVFVDWRLSLSLVAFWVIVVGSISFFFMRNMAELTAKFGEAQTQVSATTVDMLDGIKEIKNFQMADATKTDFYEKRKAFSALSYAWVSESGKAISFTGALLKPSIVFLTVVLLVVVFLANSWISFSASIPFLLIAPGIPEGLLTLMGLSQHIYQSTFAAQSNLQLLSKPRMPQGTQELAEKNPALELTDVSFSYEKDKPIIQHVSLRVEPGTVTAVVGPSGSGKSTLAKLIVRFYDPDSGSIKLGGVELRDLSFKALYSNVSIVLQDAILSNDTVFNNIVIGKPEATLDEVVQAAKAAQIHEKILSLPQGYDTRLGEKDGFLSGGEVQRISLARMYLLNTPVVIFDEATAQIDPEQEQAMHKALIELARDKTVIMIAHRLSSIRDVDQILCIEDGRVVEKGTHEQLLAQKGLYADMWQAQQLEFVNDVSDAVGDASATTVDTATATAPTTADEQEA